MKVLNVGATGVLGRRLVQQLRDRILTAIARSFFPSHASVSPSLTVIANALRVGDRLIEQWQRGSGFSA